MGDGREAVLTGGLTGDGSVRLAVAYSPEDPTVEQALATTLVRLWEEYRPAGAKILAFSRRGFRGRGWDKGLRRLLQDCCPPLETIIEVEEIKGIGERAVEWSQHVYRIVGKMSAGEKGHHRTPVVFSPTPSSRMLAAEGGMALGRLLSGDPDSYALVYVDFLWGQWRGLHYPLTPRTVHPLHVARPSFLERDVRGETRPPNYRAGEATVGRLEGILRSAVAALALAFNSTVPTGYWALSGDPLPPGPRVEFKLVLSDARGNSYEKSLTVKKAFDPGAWREALRQARGLVSEVAAHAEWDSGGDQLQALSGLLVPLVRDMDARIPGGGGAVVVDTNLVYSGVHNEVHRGARLVVPECAVAEVHRRYSEALKKRRQKRGALDIMAFAALHEALTAGAVVAPSPPPPCDTAVPGMSPLTLEGALLATLDEGARRYWEWHPGARGERVLELGLENLEDAPHELGEPVYALLQSLVVSGLAYVLSLSSGGAHASISVESEESRRRVSLDRYAQALARPARSAFRQRPRAGVERGGPS